MVRSTSWRCLSSCSPLPSAGSYGKRSAARQEAAVDTSLAAGPRTPWKNAQPGVKYVGDPACARCHAEIADSFRHHAMGRSLSPIARVDGPSEGTASFQVGSFRYAIERRGNRVVHRETQVDASGRRSRRSKRK